MKEKIYITNFCQMITIQKICLKSGGEKKNLVQINNKKINNPMGNVQRS